MNQKVFRTGNSLAVVVPSRFVMAIGIKPGDKVQVRIEESRGRVVYRFSGARQMLFDEQFFRKRKQPR